MTQPLVTSFFLSLQEILDRGLNKASIAPESHVTFTAGEIKKLQKYVMFLCKAEMKSGLKYI